MWCEEFQDKNDITKYRFIEKYKCPLTDKWKRTSVVMNKNTKPSQKEAERRLQAKIQDKLKVDKLKDIKTLTFHQALKEWQEHYKTHSGNKASTIRTYIPKSNKLLKLFKDDILIANITLPYAQSKFDDLTKEKLSSQYNRDVLMIFKNIMKHISNTYGVEFEYLDKLVVGKKAKTVDDVKAKKENYLETSEVKSVVEEIRLFGNRKQSKHNHRYYNYIADLIEFMALNGMRVGEALAIQPHNIDFENQTLTIDGTILWTSNKKGEFGIKETTKNDSSYRTISINKRSCDILRKLILENKKSTMWEDTYNDRGFVFTNHTGNPIYFGRINDVLKLACENCGIKKRVTTHTLRHTHISILTQNNIPLKSIMQRVGHSDHRTTLQIYSHVTDKMNQELKEQLEAVVL